MKKRIRKQTVTQCIMAEAAARLATINHDSTRKQYISHIKSYVRYCRTMHDARTLQACEAYAQEYCDYLTKSGEYSASTVHTYMAAIDYNNTNFEKEYTQC